MKRNEIDFFILVIIFICGDTSLSRMEETYISISDDKSGKGSIENPIQESSAGEPEWGGRP